MEVLEGAVVATFVVAGLAALTGTPDLLVAGFCVGAIAMRGMGHMLAAHGNREGRQLAVVRPIVRLYQAIDRVMGRG